MKFRRIKKKEIFHYKGDVYDLEVRDQHSYNVDKLIVHNSGAGSLLNYALDVTQVDPMKYDLIFERFLNPARTYKDDQGETHLVIPDIDQDFSDKRSDEIYDFINQHWGQEHCCNIATFQNLKIKAVIKDVARVYEIEPQEANNITKLITNDMKTFDDILVIPEIKEFFDRYPDILKYSKVFANLPRSVSQHPAGIVVLPNELSVTDIIPVKSSKPTDTGNTWDCSQYCKEEVDLLGGIKYDILRLKNIDIIVEELKMINQYYNKNYTQMSIPLNDKKTWDFICEAAYLKGIFQMDGAAAQPVIKKIQPQDMESLSAVNAFIRPGTSGLDEYVEGKKDPEKIRLMGYKPFDDVLAPTMGGIVYQEQVMSLISILFNISFGESDIYRRALEKPDKKKNKDRAQYFYDNAERIGLENGIPKEACQKVTKAIIDNSAYLFNKSHSIDVYVSYKHVASYRKIG